jgi:hypothetical protein
LHTVVRVRRFHGGEKNITPLTTSIAFAQDLIEPRVEVPATLPIEEQVRQDVRKRIAVANALAGLGKFQGLGGDRRPWNGKHSAGQLTRCRDAQSLPEDAIRRIAHGLREVVNKVRQQERVGRKRYTAIVDPSA